MSDEPITEIKKIISQNSVELKRNAKGDHQWDIKVYDDDIKIACEKSILVDRYFTEEYGE